MREPIDGEHLYHPADDADYREAESHSTGLLELEAEDDGAGAGDLLGVTLDMEAALDPFVLAPTGEDVEAPAPDTLREPPSEEMLRTWQGAA